MALDSFRTYFVQLLVLATAVLLSASTLHSHRHIEWHHPSQGENTGECLGTDTTLCPICAHIITPELPADSSASIYSSCERFSTANNDRPPSPSFSAAIPGRSPPKFQ